MTIIIMSIPIITKRIDADYLGCTRDDNETTQCHIWLLTWDVDSKKCLCGSKWTASLEEGTLFHTRTSTGVSLGFVS